MSIVKKTKSSISQKSKIKGEGHCCEKCGRVLANAWSLKQHLELYCPDLVDEKVKCETCNLEFKNKKSMLVHCNRIHNRDRTVGGVKKHICELCGKSYLNSHALKEHSFNVHKIGSYVYKCGVCSETFSSQFLLNKHKKVSHLELRTHVCELCGSAYYRSMDLKTHFVKVHMDTPQTTDQMINALGKGPYTCQFCGKVMTSKFSFRHHVKYKHTREVGPYPCNICQKTFAHKTTLRVHKRKAHEGFKNPYKCAICEKAFLHPGGLSTHLTTAHGLQLSKEDLRKASLKMKQWAETGENIVIKVKDAGTGLESDVAIVKQEEGVLQPAEEIGSGVGVETLPVDELGLKSTVHVVGEGGLFGLGGAEGGVQSVQVASEEELQKLVGNVRSIQVIEVKEEQDLAHQTVGALVQGGSGLGQTVEVIQGDGADSSFSLPVTCIDGGKLGKFTIVSSENGDEPGLEGAEYIQVIFD